jgi:2-polyprenyl-6-methoxyphenol hydroxylase-like FAD-dependent oxidoreductase
MTKNAIVAGGGIAGTVAAIALHRVGVRPVVYEARPRDTGEEGAFLTVAVNGLTALRALGLDPGAVLAAGFPTPRLRLGNGSGRVLADLPLGGPTADGVTTTTIRRADLYAALRTAAAERGIPIRYGRRLVAVAEDGNGVTATFATGEGGGARGGAAGDGVTGEGGGAAGQETARGDLLIGADGLRSRTRHLLDPAAPQPRYLGLLNAGGFTTEPVAADLDRTPGLVHMTFGRRCFVGWSVAPDGSVWWFANPPAKRPTDPAAWTAASRRAHLLGLVAGDAGPAAAIIEATGEVLGPWNTFDLPRVPVWRTGRSVLIGDAAHAASPSSGQGASMAIEDAVTLGRCVAASADVPGALAAYERARRTRVEKVVAFGRRSSSGKTAGPVGGWLRDALTPTLMRMLYRKGDPAAWILDHRM